MKAAISVVSRREVVDLIGFLLLYCSVYGDAYPPTPVIIVSAHLMAQSWGRVCLVLFLLLPPP